MTLDKFGRHLDIHKTKKYINEQFSVLSNTLTASQPNIEELKKDFKIQIKNIKDDIQIEISKIKYNFKIISVINLILNLHGDFYNIINSLDNSAYTFPFAGRIVDVRLSKKENLNYKINEGKRVSLLINKNVRQGDKLKILTGPANQKTQQLYMELILVTPVQYVGN